MWIRGTWFFGMGIPLSNPHTDFWYGKSGGAKAAEKGQIICGIGNMIPGWFRQNLDIEFYSAMWAEEKLSRLRFKNHIRTSLVYLPRFPLTFPSFPSVIWVQFSIPILSLSLLQVQTSGAKKYASLAFASGAASNCLCEKKLQWNTCRCILQFTWKLIAPFLSLQHLAIVLRP